METGGSVVPPSDPPSDQINAELELVKTHMEFLGYRTRWSDGNALLHAEVTADGPVDFTDWMFHADGSGITAFFGIRLDADSPLLDQLLLSNAINMLARTISTSVCTLDSGPCLMAEAFLRGTYSRNTFCFFIHDINKEALQINTCHELDPIFARVGL